MYGKVIPSWRLKIASLQDDEGTIKTKQRRMQSRKAKNKIHRVSTSDFKQPDRFVTFSLGKEDCLETECCSFRGIERNP